MHLFDREKPQFHPGFADYNHVIIINDYNHDYINVRKSSYAISTFQANDIRERKHLQINFIVFAVNSFLVALISTFGWVHSKERNRLGTETAAKLFFEKILNWFARNFFYEKFF